jgi:hypothetical protein
MLGVDKKIVNFRDKLNNQLQIGDFITLARNKGEINILKIIGVYSHWQLIVGNEREYEFTLDNYSLSNTIKLNINDWPK